MTFQIKRWLIHPQVWKFVCLASTVIGLVCYPLSSSFTLLFGHWNLLKIFSYSVFSSIICIAVWFAKVCQHLHSKSLMCKAHLSVVVLTATTMYSFFYDKAVNRKPDAYSLISCASFAIMSLSLSRQTHLGFEVDLLYFFLSCLILQLMKIKLWLAIVGAGFSYSLVILRSSLPQIEAYYCFPQPNPDIALAMSDSTGNSHSSDENETNLVKPVLISCAKAISENDLIMAKWLMGELRGMVSVSGEPIQRLGAYMLEGLVARLAASGSSIYKALKNKKRDSAELLSYTHVIYQIIPYVKLGYMSANGAILEAMKDEERIHIIDFQITGSQWITLIRDFADRPGGPPHVRITVIDDLTSVDAIQMVENQLSRLAEDFKVPFEFHSADVSAFDVQPHNLGLQPGEALAVNFAFALHQVPDESVNTQNHRDRLLRLVKSLSPKVVTFFDLECNTNTLEFFPRFLETLDYYTAIVESIDLSLPRDNEDRIIVEQYLLGKEVVNIIACEGDERVVRHELLEKWRSRFAVAGFTPYPLSSTVKDSIMKLLKNYSDSYRIKERDGALYLGWKDRDLIASSAWKCDSLKGTN